MPANSLASFHSDTTWFPGDDHEIYNSPEAVSPRLTTASAYPDSIITVPTSPYNDTIQSQETVVSARFTAAGGSMTPELRQKIARASPATARYVAMRMYDSMKRHGLGKEIEEAVMKGHGGSGGDMMREVVGGDEKGGGKGGGEELTGMEYLLKDGFVSYLRDVARVTPPIPRQVVRFSGIKYSKKFEISDMEYETFGNKVLGCFLGPFKTLYCSTESTWLHILKGVDGYIMPGSITLLLGPPG